MRQIMWRSGYNREFNIWIWIIINVQETQFELENQRFFLLQQYSFHPLCIDIENLTGFDIISCFMIWN